MHNGSHRSGFFLVASGLFYCVYPLLSPFSILLNVCPFARSPGAHGYPPHFIYLFILFISVYSTLPATSLPISRGFANEWRITECVTSTPGRESLGVVNVSHYKLNSTRSKLRALLYLLNMQHFSIIKFSILKKNLMKFWLIWLIFCY